MTPDLSYDYIGGRELRGEDNTWDGKKKKKEKKSIGVRSWRMYIVVFLIM